MTICLDQIYTIKTVFFQEIFCPSLLKQKWFSYLKIMLPLFLDFVDDFIQAGRKRVVKDWQRCLEPDKKN